VICAIAYALPDANGKERPSNSKTLSKIFETIFMITPLIQESNGDFDPRRLFITMWSLAFLRK
jgi:hypothetical protein